MYLIIISVKRVEALMPVSSQVTKNKIGIYLLLLCLYACSFLQCCFVGKYCENQTALQFERFARLGSEAMYKIKHGTELALH